MKSVIIIAIVAVLIGIAGYLAFTSSNQDSLTQSSFEYINVRNTSHFKVCGKGCQAVLYNYDYNATLYNCYVRKANLSDYSTTYLFASSAYSDNNYLNNQSLPQVYNDTWTRFYFNQSYAQFAFYVQPYSEVWLQNFYQRNIMFNCTSYF